MVQAFGVVSEQEFMSPDFKPLFTGGNHPKTGEPIKMEFSHNSFVELPRYFNDPQENPVSFDLFKIAAF